MQTVRYFKSAHTVYFYIDQRYINRTRLVWIKLDKEFSKGAIRIRSGSRYSIAKTVRVNHGDHIVSSGTYDIPRKYISHMYAINYPLAELHPADLGVLYYGPGATKRTT